MAPDIRRTLRTDFGDFDMPPKIAEAFGAAKARRDGRPDRRTNFGKQLWAYEARQRKQLGEKFALGPKAGPMTLEPEL